MEMNVSTRVNIGWKGICEYDGQETIFPLLHLFKCVFKVELFTVDDES